MSRISIQRTLLLQHYSLRTCANSDRRKQVDNRVKKVWHVVRPDGTGDPSRVRHDISNANNDSRFSPSDIGCPNEGDFTRPGEGRQHVSQPGLPGQPVDSPVIIAEPLEPTTPQQAMLEDVLSDSGKRKIRPSSCHDEPARKRQRDMVFEERNLELKHTDSPTATISSTDYTQEGTPSVIISSSSALDSDSTLTPTTSISQSSWSTSETIRWSQQLESYLEIPRQIDTPAERIRVDYSRSIQQYTPEEMRQITKAADFLFSCALYEDAFPLYLLIHKKRVFDLQPPEIILNALIACARSAATDKDMEDVRDMLLRYLADLPHPKHLEKPSNWLELDFIIRSLIASVSIQLNLRNNSLAATNAMSVIPDPNILLKRMGVGLTELDLTTYWYYRFEVKVQRPIETALIEERYPVGPSTCQQNLTKLRQHLLQQDPGPFELRFDKAYMKNRCLRECLNWCSEELEVAINVRAAWKSLRQQVLDSRWADSMAIYLFLWSRWNQLHGEDNVKYWFAEMEKSGGISTAEFLNTASSLMIKASLNEKEQGQIKIPRYLQNKDSDVLRRARDGARLLSNLPDNKLAGKFLDHYVECADDAWPPSIPSPYGRLNR